MNNISSPRETPHGLVWVRDRVTYTGWPMDDHNTSPDQAKVLGVATVGRFLTYNGYNVHISYTILNENINKYDWIE